MKEDCVAMFAFLPGKKHVVSASSFAYNFEMTMRRSGVGACEALPFLRIDGRMSGVPKT